MVFYGDKKNLVYYNSFKNIRTSWDANNLVVYFSDPSLFDQTSKVYRFRIKEIDKTWQSTSLNFFTYLGLKYGSYTLELKSADDNTIEVPFYVGKPWYYSYLAILCYLLMLAAIAWALVKFFRYKINRQKELVAMELKQTSLEQELDYKSYELMLTIRYLIHKNEILTELQNEINDIKNHSSKYPIKNLKSMERIISEGLDTQTDDWKNAMSSLKLSQQGFFKKLMEQFPHLTTNDLRLCSYLRMNFSTKEIARLLNNSTRAVEISRYRLRKKMNLNHDVNLTEFLMSETFADTSSEPI
jgi:DNA-binding CsgD family transcriptional regulator